MKFKVGDRVVITNDGLQTYGFTGRIEHKSYWGDSYDVKLDQIPKTYTYNPKNLTLANEQNNINNNINEGVNTMIGNYYVAMVKFLQGTNTTKEYGFALFDTNIIIDDYVLCDTQNGYGVAKIIKIIPKSEYDGTKITREIICKVDFTDFENRKENRAKAIKLKTDMDKKIKEMQELAIFEMMAKESSELKEMLDAYKELMN